MERIKQHPKLLAATSNLAFAMIVFAFFGIMFGPHAESSVGLHLLTPGFAYDYVIGAIGFLLNAVVIAAKGAGRFDLALSLCVASIYTAAVAVLVL